MRRLLAPNFSFQPASIGAPSFFQYPHPYPVEKFLVFNDLQTGLRCKILSAIELAAESSQERTYGPFGGAICAFLFRFAVLMSAMNVHAAALPRLELQLAVCGDGWK